MALTGGAAAGSAVVTRARNQFDPIVHVLTTMAGIAEVTEFKTKTGISSIEDFSFLTFDDLKDGVPDTTPNFRLRILEASARYIAYGNAITVDVTAQQVQQAIADHAKPQPVTVTTRASPTRSASQLQSRLKTQVNAIPTFAGDPMDYDGWKIKTIATMKQGDHGFIFDRAPVSAPTKVAVTEERLSMEFYNMLVTSLHEGTAYHLLTDIPNEDGHLAWTAIEAFYSSSSTVAQIVRNHQSKLEQLTLDDDTTATSYINDFQLCCKKLKEHKEGLTERAMTRKFLDGIECELYDVIKILIEAQIDSITFVRVVEMIRAQEMILTRNDTKTASSEATSTIRRATHSHDRGGRDGGGDRKFFIPSIPSYIYSELNESIRGDMLAWRNSVNATGLSCPKREHLQDGGGKRGRDDEENRGSRTSSGNKSGGSQRGKNGKYNNKKFKKNRRSVRIVPVTTAIPGSKDPDEARVRFLSEDELSETQHSVCDEDEDDLSIEPGDQSKVNTGKTIRRIVARRGRPVTSLIVLDSGCETPVIGGKGWYIQQEHVNSTMHLSGPTPGLGSESFHLADGCTAISTADGKTMLLGIRDATFNPDPDQNEALLNPYHLLQEGMDVCVVPKEFGGQQKVTVNDATIDLDYDEKKWLMTISCRHPTDRELEELDISWISSSTLSSSFSMTRRKSKTVDDPVLEDASAPTVSTDDALQSTSTVTDDVGASQGTKGGHIEWKKSLGYPNEEVLKHTMAHTTQFCEAPVEMETRQLPRQHRKQRILPLHPRRLRGRTDTDTFFSSVPSIRKYGCVQLFVATAFQFVFVRCLMREKQSHIGLQDFIREVGAPTTLLADNSKTQNGKKWTSTARQYAIRQRNSTPHNQNQNSAERKIQVVKKRTDNALRQSNAPLVFWCYCLYFIVDCLNFSSTESLGWRSPTELLTGDTPDISMFRFEFWQPVEVYDNPAPFPKPKMIDARFIGIAWTHGDAFTYKVWTEPDGDWRNGKELVRNFVRPRVLPGTPSESQNDIAEFKLMKSRSSKKKKSRKRKRKSSSKISDTTKSASDDTADMIDVEELETQSSTLIEDPIPDGDPLAQSIADDDSTQEVNDSTLVPPEMTDEINDHMSLDESSGDIGGAKVQRVINHRWKEGRLQLNVEWPLLEDSWEELLDMKEDHPRMTSSYLLQNAEKIQRNTRRTEPCITWARKTERDIRRAVRRVINNYDFIFDNNTAVRCVRRSVKNNKKRKKVVTSTTKYGIKVPRTVKQAIELDKANGNTFWWDAIQKEMSSLEELECFSFRDSDDHPGSDYQKTTLHMVFDVKHDLRHKARLVAGGHLVDVLDHHVYSSNVKSISVQILHLIAHKMNLTQLCGDVGNAFVNAYTKEKIYAIAGPEFGDNEGKIVVLVKALYGLATSCERFHAHFADILRSLGFRSTRFDRDVWIRLSKDKKSYEYICTHVDDFMIVAKEPDVIMKLLQKVYLIKAIGPPEYYLGNDYKKDPKGRYVYGCKQYLKEALVKVEAIHGSLPKQSTPMVPSDHPEQDQSEVLNPEEHRKYQMLIGMLNWLVAIGRFDIAFAVSSLARFVACPRKAQLQKVLYIFGYLKKFPNKRIQIESKDPTFIGSEEALNKDLVKEFAGDYPDAKEEIDPDLPAPLVPELSITGLVDSDHAHDTVTRRSITGLFIFIGSTPVLAMSKRQGAIETSTYGAEFNAMKTAVEEVISVRYMLRCLGVKVSKPSIIFGDNKSVIFSCDKRDSLLKKKHTAIAYHKARESAAAGIVRPVKIGSQYNYSDMLTKSLNRKAFAFLRNNVMV